MIAPFLFGLGPIAAYSAFSLFLAVPVFLKRDKFLAYRHSTIFLVAFAFLLLLNCLQLLSPLALSLETDPIGPGHFSLLFPMTVHSGEGWLSLSSLLNYGLFFAYGIILGREDDESCWRALNVIAVTASLFALLGLWMLFASNNDQNPNFSSLLINRNHLATLLGISLLATITLLIKDVQTYTMMAGGNGRLFLSILLRELFARSKWAFLSLLILAPCLLFTNSRAGILIFWALIVLLPLIFFLRLYRPRSRRVWLFTLLGVTVLPLAFLEFFGSGLSQRLQADTLSEGRLIVYNQILDLISDKPLWGFGAGNFQAVFATYKTSSLGITKVWDFAHNDMLELLVEYGYIGVTLYATVWLMMAVALFRGFFHRVYHIHFPLLGLMVWTGVTLHSFVDFSLQVPAIGLYTLTLIGMGMAQGHRRR